VKISKNEDEEQEAGLRLVEKQEARGRPTARREASPKGPFGEARSKRPKARGKKQVYGS
jgi:hypothetical protein